MKTKAFRGSEKKLDKIEEYRKHFGWVTKERSDDRLVMTFDNKLPFAKELNKLYKQANVITSKFPFKMIVWLALSILFFVPYFGLKDGILFGSIDLLEIFVSIFTGKNVWIGEAIVGAIPIVLILLGSLNLFFTLYVVAVFFALKLSKKSTLGEIYRIADALSGNVIDAPLIENIEPDGPLTGQIAKIANKIGDRN